MDKCLSKPLLFVRITRAKIGNKKGKIEKEKKPIAQ